MAHFAHINNSSIVDEVIVAEQEFVDTLPDKENWIQTSYNTKGNVHYDPETGQPSDREALRGNYAGVGYIYDRDNDVFYPPSPYPSWVISPLNWTWEPPRLGDGNKY